MSIHTRFPSLDRQAIEDQIEELIALLDTMDGDSDLEHTGDFEDSHDREEDPSWFDWEDQSEPPAGAVKSRESHRRRIRRTACERFTRFGVDSYKLRRAF